MPLRIPSTADKKAWVDLDQAEVLKHFQIESLPELRKKFPKISPAVIEKFAQGQWRKLAQLVQDYEIRKGHAEAPAPDLKKFPPSGGKSVVLTDEDGKWLQNSLKTAHFKALQVGKADGDDKKVLTDAEVQAQLGGALTEADALLQELAVQVLNAQMLSRAKEQEAEAMRALKKIWAMAKAGQVDFRFVIIAMTKVQMTQQGALSSLLGQQAYLANKRMGQISADLQNMNPSDPKYSASVVDVQTKTRDLSTQMQMIIPRMQEVASKIGSSLDFCKSTLDAISRQEIDLIRMISAR